MSECKCVCDEMMDKTMKDSASITRYRESIALSWECPKHGKVTVDNRTVHIQQAPDPIKQDENVFPRFKGRIPMRRVRA